jgi:two-component system, NtrC family, nitrogen regulation response regulator GlnG
METVSATSSGSTSTTSSHPNQDVVVTILCHPDIDRIGEVARLFSAGANQERRLSRKEPRFHPVFSPESSGAPLQTMCSSAEPIRIESRSTGVTLSRREFKGVLRVDGEEVTESLELTLDELSRGKVVQFGDFIAVLIHLGRRHAEDEQALLELRKNPAFAELIGESDALLDLLTQIDKTKDEPDRGIALFGEIGTGKQLVGSAIHDISRRKGSFSRLPCFGATAELVSFDWMGSKKVLNDKGDVGPGAIQQKAPGTLMFDDFQHADREVQKLFVQILDKPDRLTVRPYGGGVEEVKGLRWIVAFNAEPDAIRQSDDAPFELALKGLDPNLPSRLRRGYCISVPPLRERRSDVGRLLRHFLLKFFPRDQAIKLEKPAVDGGPGPKRPWLRADAVCRLVGYEWPENVRELEATVRQLVDKQASNHKCTPEAIQLRAAPSVMARTQDEPPIIQKIRKLGESDPKLAEAALLSLKINRTEVAERIGLNRLQVMRRLGKGKL